MKLVFVLSLLASPVVCMRSAELDKSFRMYPGGGNGTSLEKQIHERNHANLRSIKHFFLAGGWVSCIGPALNDSVTAWLNEFVSNKAKNSFEGIDVTNFPSGDEFNKLDKKKWGNLEVRLIMVPAAGVVSYHLRLMITGMDSTASTPYIDETVGIVSIKDAYIRDTFRNKISLMIDDAAIFMAGPK